MVNITVKRCQQCSQIFERFLTLYANETETQQEKNHVKDLWQSFNIQIYDAMKI